MAVNKSMILIPLPAGCVQGIFLRRVKRFSVEIRLGKESVWAHCNNSGSMLGLLRPGSPVIISPAKSPCRKLPWTLERIWTGEAGGSWITVNTLVPNRLLKAAFEHGLLDFAAGYDAIRMEAVKGESRLDALLTGPDKPALWVECKNVTLVEDGVAAFPDAESKRACKHLQELMGIRALGARAAMFYCIQRTDGQCFAPAGYIDHKYESLFYKAMEAGVEMYPYLVQHTMAGISLGGVLKIRQQTVNEEN